MVYLKLKIYLLKAQTPVTHGGCSRPPFKTALRREIVIILGITVIIIIILYQTLNSFL